MITAKQEKNKTTIIVPRRLRKTELDRVMRYLSFLEIKPNKKTVSKKAIQKLADEVNTAAWERFRKMRGIK
jgi:hypothetical protein